MSTATIVTALIALAVGLIAGHIRGGWKATSKLLDMTIRESETRVRASKLEQDNAKLRNDVNRMLKHQMEL